MEKMATRFAFNGKFLTQRMTGVQRYAFELITHFDGLTLPDGQFELLVPRNAKEVPALRHIRVVTVGTKQGVPWEQVDYPSYCKKHHLVPVNLCNAGPLSLPGIVCIHDVKVKRFPQFFSLAFRLWYDIMLKKEIAHAKRIITVSEFSKGEIMEWYHVQAERITVIPNAWQQFNSVKESEGVLEKYQVGEKGFFFTLGSPEPNKNLPWIAKEAEKNPASLFLVAGKIDGKVFAEEHGVVFPSNVRLLGFVPDGEVKALMRHAKALLFPSFYEGFGLPPIEALSQGTPVIVSDIPVLHEVFEGSATYVDPHKSDYLLDHLVRWDGEETRTVLEKYSWEKSARLLERVTKEVE